MTVDMFGPFREDRARVAGIDEAGRGPLAGPVLAAAVILDPSRPISGLADSKRLSPKRRDALADRIRDDALDWGLGRADVEEIDRLNILQAALLAMRRAAAQLSAPLDAAYVDGNARPRLSCAVVTVIGGDATVPAISAASILAKTARDRDMTQLAAAYPEYGFERHKGYATSEHIRALARHGPSIIHRRSFAPVCQAYAARDPQSQVELL